MASINNPTNEKVFRITKWLGVNECPESETDLRYGEASSMTNFRITDDYALKIRPGSKTVKTLSPIKGLWTGYVGSSYVMLAAAGGKLYSIDPEDNYSLLELGNIDTTNNVHIFGFDEKAYLLNGSEYKVWDGTTLQDVSGYIPLVATATVPSGGGVGLEQANKLSPKKRQKFSPDGDSATFKLAESNIASVDFVKLNGTELTYSSSQKGLDKYSYDLAEGTITVRTSNTEIEKQASLTSSSPSYITISDVPSNAHVYRVSYFASASNQGDFDSGDYSFDKASGVVTVYVGNLAASSSTVTTYLLTVAYYEVIPEGINTLEIQWTGADVDLACVKSMRFSELYNGKNDNRVFLYGNGSNMAIYSGLDEYGNARADYFPDLNVAHFGTSNNPITSMIRHYDRLLCFKDDSTYSTYYDTVTLPDGTVTAGFYITPVNRILGNVAPGQPCLVENRPRTVSGKDLYEWKATSTSGNITGDQRNASALSERFKTSLSKMNLENAIMFNDKYNREFYIVQNGTAIVNNYDNDTWYVYDSFPATHMVLYKNELYYATSSGEIRHVSENYRDDDGTSFNAEWISGSMNFGSEHLNKYSSMIWLGLKPENGSEVKVSIETDRNETYSDVIIGLPEGHVTKIKKIKLRSRKFSYYKLKLETGGGKTATIINANIRVAFAGSTR